MKKSATFRCKITKFSDGTSEGTLWKMYMHVDVDGLQLKFPYNMNSPRDLDRLAGIARKLGIASEYFKPSDLLGMEFIGKLKNGKQLVFHDRVK